MKRRLLSGLLLAGLLLLSACGQNPAGSGAAAAGQPEESGGQTEDQTAETADNQAPDEQSDQTTDQTEEEPEMSENTPEAGKRVIEIEMQDYGTITVELDGDAAPLTVENFVGLVEEGFYDGLTLHRIISGFMIQGGDPLGNGTGGSEQNIKGEFAANGVDNPLSHIRGAISMARSQMMDSASSQFFIVHQDSLFLDGQYAAFGYVTNGIEVVDAICDAVAVQDGNGSVAKKDQPVITSIRVVG